MKIDANSDGRVDWNEFTNYMFISNADINTDESFQPIFRLKDEDEYSKKINGEPVVQQYHREKIVRIFYYDKFQSYVSVSQDGTIMVWKPDTLEFKFSISILKYGHAKWILDAADMQKAGEICLATMEYGLLFYDLNYENERPIGKIHRSNLCENSPVKVQCYCDENNNSDIIFVGDDSGYIHIYTLKHWIWHICDGNMSCHSSPQRSGVKEYHMKIHSDQITGLCYAEQIESILTCSLDGTCTVINYEQKKIKKIFKDHKTAPYDILWCDNKKCIISGGRDKELLMWNPYSDMISGTLVGHTSPVVNLTYCSSLEKLISLDDDGTMRIWEIKEQKCIQIISGVLTTTTAVCYDPKREVLISGFKKLSMYGLLHPTINNTSTTHIGSVVSVLFNQQFNQILTCDNVGNVCVWDPENGKLISSFNTNENCDEEENNDFTCITSCSFDYSGRRLVVGFHTGDAVRIYNYNSGGLLTELFKPWSYNEMKILDNIESLRDKKSINEISTVLYIHYPNKTDNELCQIVAGDCNSTLYVWNDSMGEEERDGYYRKLPNKRDITEAHSDDISCLCAIPPKYMASGGLDGILIIWDIWGGNIEAKFTLESSIEQLLLLKKYQLLFAARSDGIASVYNVVTLTYLMDIKFYPHGENITAIKTNYLESYIALGDSFGAIKIYKLYNPTESQIFLQLYAYWQAHNQPITSLDIIDSDIILHDYIISGSSDNNVNVWSLEGSFIGTLGQIKEWNYNDPKSFRDSVLYYFIIIA